MTVTNAELFEVLRDARPSPNMERKPLPTPKQPTAAAPMCAPLPPKRVELPALGGSIEIEYEDWEP